MLKIKIIILLIIIILLSSCENKSNPTEIDNQDGDKTVPIAIIDIQYRNSTLWFGTSGGLFSTNYAGENIISHVNKPGMIEGGVSALYVSEDYIFVAGAIDSQLTDSTIVSAGTGFSYSNNNGQSWTQIPQPIDNEDETSYTPTTSTVQNLIYDITLNDNSIWIASFGGGLRRSDDFGITWEVVTIDNIPFDPLNNLTHRLFSVISFHNEIWAGTAGGIGHSIDGGINWEIFNHQNQAYPISGNFVVALGYQQFNNTIWASTIEAVDIDESRAVSKTTNGGQTWGKHLEGQFAHNFYFDASKVFIATDESLFESEDNGSTWNSFTSLTDSIGNIYSVCNISDSSEINYGLWVGGSNGIAHSKDNGENWKIINISTGSNISKGYMASSNTRRGCVKTQMQ